MMKGMREFGRTTGARVFLSLLALAFIGWGIGEYLVRGVSGAGLTVNGDDVSLQELQQSYEGRKQQLAQVMGHQPTDEELVTMRLADIVVLESINRAVLRQAGHNLGLQPAPAQLKAQIAGIPVFQGDNGQFSNERYLAALRQVGMTPKQFEQEMAKDLSVSQLTQLVQVAGLNPDVVRSLASLENATLNLETLTLTPAMVASKVRSPDAAALQTFYKDNAALYTTPEKRSFAMLMVSGPEIAQTITVPESAMRAYYTSNTEAYAQPETRDIMHILVDNEARAKELATQATDDAIFMRLAREFSEDPGSKANGGDLGTIAKSDVVPEFGDVAFSLPVGQTSQPVKSSFGWHIIRVKRIVPATTPAFEDVRNRIEEEMKQSEASNAVAELSDKVARAVENGDSLEKIAQANGLSVARQPLVTANEQTALPAEVVAAAFGLSLDDGAQSISDPINLPDGRQVYVELTQIVPSRVQPFADVQTRVAADARRALEKQALQTAAQDVLNRARAPGAPVTLAAAAQAIGVSASSERLTLAGLEGMPNWVQPAYQGITQLGQGETLARPVNNGDALVVVRLAERTLGTPTPANLQQTAGAYRERLQADVESMIISRLVRTADVDFNASGLRQIFGEQYTPRTPTEMDEARTQ